MSKESQIYKYHNLTPQQNLFTDNKKCHRIINYSPLPTNPNVMCEFFIRLIQNILGCCGGRSFEWKAPGYQGKKKKEDVKGATWRRIGCGLDGLEKVLAGKGLGLDENKKVVMQGGGVGAGLASD